MTLDPRAPVVCDVCEFARLATDNELSSNAAVVELYADFPVTRAKAGIFPVVESVHLCRGFDKTAGEPGAWGAETFCKRTLGEFEDASASIVLRQLVRAFEGAGIRLGGISKEWAASAEREFAATSRASINAIRNR